MKKSFTMIELVFIIVILGILAAVAMPKLLGTRDDAQISKGLGQIRAITNEISSYVVSQMKSEDNLSQMSNVLSELESSGKVVIDTANKKATIKYGDIDDCIILRVVSGANEQNLTLTFGNSDDDVICKGIQNNIHLENYPIVLRGQLVNY